MVISETSRHLGNYVKTDNEPTDRRGGRTDGVIVKFHLQDVLGIVHDGTGFLS